jgi:short-subunit dehydrogenase
VIVTGASSGIGRALVLELAPQRPNLVLAARDGARLEEVAAQCRDKGALTLVVKSDVASPGIAVTWSTRRWNASPLSTCSSTTRASA